MGNLTYFVRYENFLDFYNKHIYSNLCEIDILIKSKGPIYIEDVSNLLNLEEGEVNKIMAMEKIDTFNRENFFKIMALGSSYICKLYSREINCGSPFTYTPSQIAYIYELDLSAVLDVCFKLNIQEVTSLTLPSIFENISSIWHFYNF